MKPILTAATLALSLFSAQALAAQSECGTGGYTFLSASAITSLVEGKVVREPSSKPGWTWENQERHNGGTFTEISDNSTGRYTITDSSSYGVITYTYSPGVTAQFAVGVSGSTYKFCGDQKTFTPTIG